jgi:hypothetical protein
MRGDKRRRRRTLRYMIIQMSLGGRVSISSRMRRRR